MIEWDRRDLLESSRDAERIEWQYAAFLGVVVDHAPPEAHAAAKAPPPAREVRSTDWALPLAAVAPLLSIVVLQVAGEVTAPPLTLSLVLLSSLLLLGAALPPGVVARTPVAPARFARVREPLGLAAIGVLVPVAVFTLLATVT